MIRIIRKPIKHLYLRIHVDGEIVVSAPMHCPNEVIDDFIDSKATWIAQKRQQQQQRLISAKRLQTDENTLVLWGNRHPIKYRVGHRHGVELIDNIGYVTLRQSSSIDKRQGVINAYYREQLLVAAQNHVDHYQSLLKVRVHEIRTRQMKSRWGSCNIVAKRLWFNRQLARFHRKCLEYVVVHEMVHLIERGHNRRFYRLIGEVMPDWQKWHNLLKTLC